MRACWQRGLALWLGLGVASGCAIRFSPLRPPESRDAEIDDVVVDGATDGDDPNGDVAIVTTDGPCGARGQPCCADGACQGTLECYIDDRCRCGAIGQPCCTPDTGAAACVAGSECIAGRCRCGGAGEACCVGNMCAAGLVCGGDMRCDAPPTCAGSGVRCAPLGCCAGLVCGTAGNCEAPAMCGAMGALCVGATCCPPLVCSTATRSCDAPPPPCARDGESCGSANCCTGLACTAGRCAPPAPMCGAAGESCCSGGRCADGNRCTDPVGAGGACAPCGRGGSYCCPGASCGGGAGCWSGITASGYVCAFTAFGVGPGQRCGYIAGRDRECSSGYICRGTSTYEARCLACGRRNQPCCAGETCGSGLRCISSSSVADICVP